MFDRLKERFSRKHDDLGIDDMRAGVLGRPSMDFQDPLPLAKGLDDFNPDTPQRAPARVPDALSSGFGNSRYGEPVAMDTGFSDDRRSSSGRDFDIMDRLNLIESQLTAIRSQTETINERLKNLEVKLGYGRRY